MIQRVQRKFYRLQKDAQLIELVRGSGLVLLFKVLGALAGYAFIILVSQWLGASGYGVYELAFTIIMMVSVFARLGLEGALVKYISEFFAKDEWGKIRGIYTPSAILVLLLSSLLGLLTYTFAPVLSGLFDGDDLTAGFQLSGLIIPAFTLLQLNADAMRGLRRMTDFSLLQNGTVMMLATLIFWIITEIGEPDALAAVQSFGAAVGLVLIWSFWLIYRSYRDDLHRVAAKKVDFVRVLKTALPMLVSGSLFFVVSWTDTLMVGYYLGDENVGIYRFAFKMATLITFTQFAINSMAAPMISAFHSSKNVMGFRRIIRQIGLLNFTFSLPVFFILMFFPTWVLQTAGGEDFISGVITLRILAIGQLVNALLGPVMNILNMTGHERDGQRIMLICAVLNIVLNLILIPLLGIIGAALATTTIMILWNGFAGWKVYQYFQIIAIPLPRKWRSL